jgi:hypothetical protein
MPYTYKVCNSRPDSGLNTDAAFSVYFEDWTCSRDWIQGLRIVVSLGYSNQLLGHCLVIGLTWSQWRRGLRHRSAAACLLGLRIWIPPAEGGGGMQQVCSFCLLCVVTKVFASGWSLIQRSATECGVSECDRETSTVMTPWPTRGCCAMKKK